MKKDDLQAHVQQSGLFFIQYMIYICVQGLTLMYVISLGTRLFISRLGTDTSC